MIKILYFQITLIACFSSFDGTSLRQCREYNSDYAWVTFYANIAGAIGPFVASLTIKDAPEGSGGNFNKIRNKKKNVFWVLGGGSLREANVTS